MMKESTVIGLGMVALIILVAASVWALDQPTDDDLRVIKCSQLATFFHQDYFACLSKN